MTVSFSFEALTVLFSIGMLCGAVLYHQVFIRWLRRQDRKGRK